MSTRPEFVQYLLDQLEGLGELRARKMFGDYLIYLNDRPALLVCDGTPFAKPLPCVAELLEDRPTAPPYEGTKAHYVLDPEDRNTLRRAAELVSQNSHETEEERIPMTIRKAAQEDHPSIYHLVRTAFATARVSDGTEQDFVLELRRRDTYRPDLELVAEENGQLIGHILLTPLPVPGAPEGLRGLMAAPLCVRLEDRNRGLGGQLLHEGGRRAAELGYNALFLVGDPEYYGRYGFRNAVSLGFQNASGVPDPFLLARSLNPDGFQEAGGMLNLH